MERTSWNAPFVPILAVRLAAGTLVAVAASSALAADRGAMPPSAPPSQQIVVTALDEVQRGSVDGREYLTLRIDDVPIGPFACRGTVLRADTVGLGDTVRRERIERSALAAMLNEGMIAVTVPLGAGHCIDGKPTFTDLRLLPPGS